MHRSLRDTRSFIIKQSATLVTLRQWLAECALSRDCQGGPDSSIGQIDDAGGRCGRRRAEPSLAEQALG
jgi:hypothetical protein